MPLWRNLTGAASPLSHERTYVLRNKPNNSAKVVLRGQDEFLYDSMAALTWRDQNHFNAWFALYM